jgi:hypothetical protein
VRCSIHRREDAVAAYMQVANQTDMAAKMSAKIIPTVVAAALLAFTGPASAEAPSAQDFAPNPPGQSVSPYPYQRFNGDYNVAPTVRLYNSAVPRRGRMGGPPPASESLQTTAAPCAAVVFSSGTCADPVTL